MADIQDSISNKPTESSESSPRISATEKVELSRSRQAEIISEIERAIRNATSPLELEYDRDETIKVGEYEGYYLNKREAQEKWSGSVPLDEYPLNEDTNPEVIRKKPTEKIVYEQQIGVRYLKPPMAPPPGDLIIRERVRSSTEPAPPPIIIRQIAQKKNKKENECNKCGLPRSPSPIIYREAPPPPPPHIPEQVIEVEKFIRKFLFSVCSSIQKICLNLSSDTPSHSGTCSGATNSPAENNRREMAPISDSEATNRLREGSRAGAACREKSNNSVAIPAEHKSQAEM